MSISKLLSECDSLLDERDVSRITGISLASLRRWRLLNTGPRFIRAGALVKYSPEDLTAWLTSRPSGGSPALDEPEVGDSKPNLSKSPRRPASSFSRHDLRSKTSSTQ
jgi:predicted DNA-binding transcriptional regulator AlpA